MQQRLTRVTGGWWPDRIIEPALQLATAVMFVTAASLFGSVKHLPFRYRAVTRWARDR